ncbi:arsenate reductase (glutaredoxin) [Indioceanicola profundi]|uniref:arsenate reductase (glutaredoxin) n=1 Tax=Indioceanicola profundi TaxID=2220096 RepID=UPI001CEC0489|nr:arsenate reductase (glutaredoxin) [Indioceanicola profundi]
MTVTIWHNPKCGTSRKVLEALRGQGIEPRIVEYLKTPPTRDELAEAAARIGEGPRALLWTKNNEALLEDNPSDGELLDRMAANPELIERPVVITPKGAAVCRPPEKLAALL